MLMEIKKKKHVLRVDEESDWLQIWTAASSLNIKGNKAIKKSLTGWFFPNRSHMKSNHAAITANYR